MKRIIRLLSGLMLGGIVMLACDVTAAAPTPPLAAENSANLYLVNSVAYSQQTHMPSSNTITDIGQAFGDIRALLPTLPPLADVSILPKITKVQPTGEKPLYVLTFKCPTEVIGIVPPPIKVLHNLVTMGMDAINSTDLLPFNMQQVCQ
jgi:hypothetical protein